VVVWTWVREHRWLTVAGLVLLIVSTAGGTAWAVFFRTVASPVSLRAALRLYRHDQDSGFSGVASLGNLSRLLAAGVYTYRTSGGESLSLLGQSRSFPARTDMVVSDRPGSCSSVSWVPLTQHTEVTTACPAADHAFSVSQLVTDEVISGTSTTTIIDCPTTTYLVPPIAFPGVRWTASCTQSGPSGTVAVDGLVVGEEPVEVAGQSIPTLHVRLTLRFAGVDVGTSPTDFWISTAQGLIVRERESTTVTQQGVHYTEQMDSTLSSLTPAS
jgi:hypothetical protein